MDSLLKSCVHVLLQNKTNEKLEWQMSHVCSTDWCRTTEWEDGHEQRAHHGSTNPTHKAKFSGRGCAQSKSGLTEPRAAKTRWLCVRYG